MSSIVDAIIARLESQVPDLRQVEGAAELSEMIERGLLPHRTPAAYVLPLGDDAEDNALGVNAMSQRLTEIVGIVLVVRVAGDARGNRRRQALEPLIEDVRDALLGWVPLPDHDPLEYQRGRLQGMQRAALIHQLDFRTRSYLRANVEE